MPKIEYSLSFENYQEMMSSRGKKKSQRTPLAVALLGLLCIVWGYSILKANANSDIPASFFPGGLLLFSGLVLTCAAMLLGLLIGSRSPALNAAGQRREYALYYADKRVFEYDDTGFRLAWYEGEDVRPWSTLRQVRDMKSLLVLGTVTTFYWLPKEALERANQLAVVRSRAEAALVAGRRFLFEVPIRPSLFVYAAAAVTHAWRTRYVNRILTYAALTLAALWFLASRVTEGRHDYWLLLFAPPLILLYEYLNSLNHYFRADWSKGSPRGEILSDGIAYRSETVRWIALFRNLHRVIEIPGAFLLYFEVNTYHVIGKRGFSSDQLAQFRTLIHNQP